MSRVFNCPTCKKAVEVEDDTPQLLAEAVKPLAEAVNALPDKFPKPVELPSTLTETLQAVAKAGEHMELTAKNWEAQRLAETEAMKESPGHPPPSPELIESWHTCPNCAPAWQKIWDNIATEARKGYVPSGEAREAVAEVARQLTATKGRA